MNSLFFNFDSQNRLTFPCFVNGTNLIKKSINDLFCDSTFELFTNYCKNNKLFYVDDLVYFDFSKLLKLNSYGVEKILKIKKILQNYLEGKQSNQFKNSFFLSSYFLLEDEFFKVSDLLLCSQLPAINKYPDHLFKISLSKITIGDFYNKVVKNLSQNICSSVEEETVLGIYVDYLKRISVSQSDYLLNKELYKTKKLLCIMLISYDSYQVITQPILNIQKNIHVQTLFSSRAYRLFLTYCFENQISTLYDLHFFNFKSLSNIAGIGQSKQQAIISHFYNINATTHYSNYPISDIDDHTYDNDVNSNLSSKKDNNLISINKSLLLSDISLLLIARVRQSVVDKLRYCGINTMQSLQSANFKSLTDTLGLYNANQLLKKLEIFSKDIMDISKNVLNKSLQDRNIDIVRMRANGETLRVIGDKKHLTRERIRQIIKKFYLNLDEVLSCLVSNYLIDNNYFYKNSIESIFDDVFLNKLLVSWCKNTDKFEYLRCADLFIKSVKNFSYKNQISNLLTEYIGDFVNFDEDADEIENYIKSYHYNFMSKDAIFNLLLELGYHSYGPLIVKRKRAPQYLFSYAVETLFPCGIKIHSTGASELSELRKYITDVLCFPKIKDNVRAFSSRLCRYLVLCGRGKYISPKNIQLDMDLLFRIKDYIDSSNNKEIYYSELFANFEGALKFKTNIDNYNFLHGVLKLYFENEYDFSQRDFLVKRGKNLNSGKVTSRIKAYIADKKHPVSKQEIKNLIPGITDIVLSLALTSDKDLYMTEFSTLYSLSLLDISSKDIETISEIISKIIESNDSYCNDDLLFEEVKNTNKEFLVKNFIKTPYCLFSICQKFLSKKYDFRRPHIMKKNTLNEISLKNVSLNYFKNKQEISYKDFLAFAKSQMWSLNNAMCCFYKIQPNYIRVSEDLYVDKGTFKISEDDLNSISHFIDEHLNSGYYSLINFDKGSFLPEIGYEWNEYLLKDIIKNYLDKYRIIEPCVTDRRFERGIVVPQTSELYEYDEVVCYLLSRLGIDCITEERLLSILVEYDLTRKSIPKELYSSDHLIYEDETFCLK